MASLGRGVATAGVLAAGDTVIALDEVRNAAGRPCSLVRRNLSRNNTLYSNLASNNTLYSNLAPAPATVQFNSRDHLRESVSVFPNIQPRWYDFFFRPGHAATTNTGFEI